MSVGSKGMKARGYRLGKVADILGLSPDTLRRYEKEGKIPKIPKSLTGQRRFSLEMVDEIERIIYPDRDPDHLVAAQELASEGS